MSKPGSASFICGILLVGILALVVPAAPVRADGCVANAGGTGFSAAIDATPGQVISGSVDATGCDVGIYVGPGANGVVVSGATVTGANDHGVFAEDVSGLVIIGSTISGNGISPHGGVPEDKAVALAGTTDALVRGNTVENNMADGGISIVDDGPSIDPGAPVATATTPFAGTGNVVTGNLVEDNAFGCGIVVAAYNPGAGVSGNVVSKNTVIGGWSGAPFASIPYVGGIVIAADSPFTTATNNKVLNNVVSGSVIPGIIVHSNAPGDYVSGTMLIKNEVSDNFGLLSNTGEPTPNDAPQPTGINIVAEIFPGEPSPPVLTDTQVLSNSVSNDVNGVWLCNSVGTHIANLATASVSNSIATCAAGGS